MAHRGPIAPLIIKKHPITGEPIEPVGVVNNRYVWPIMGGAPDDGDGDDSGDGGGDGGAGDGGDDGKGDDDKGDSGTPTVEDLARQLADTEKRMKAADKRADAAEKKIKDAEKADQDELTRAKSELEEAQTALKEKDGEIRKLRLSNAFLTANKHNWHDPDTALSLADSGGYLDGVADDDGVVDKKALGSALDKLAKDKTYLVKPKDKADDTGDGPSGESGNGRSDNSKDDKARKKQLKSRFNALR